MPSGLSRFLFWGKGELADANESIHWSIPSFQGFMKTLFLLINWSHSTQGYNLLSRVVCYQQRKNMGMKYLAWTRCLFRGNPRFQLLRMAVVSSRCLSKTTGRRFDCFYMNFPKKTLFLHRHLSLPDTINNFQNFRKLLKSTRSAKKLSLGMFYCFTRSGWSCTYCKW